MLTNLQWVSLTGSLRSLRICMKRDQQQNFSIRTLIYLRKHNRRGGGGGGAGESQTFNLGEITKGKRKRALDGRMPLGLLCRYYVGEGCWAAVRGNYRPMDGWTGGGSGDNSSSIKCSRLKEKTRGTRPNSGEESKRSRSKWRWLYQFELTAVRFILMERNSFNLKWFHVRSDGALVWPISMLNAQIGLVYYNVEICCSHSELLLLQTPRWIHQPRSIFGKSSLEKPHSSIQTGITTKEKSQSEGVVSLVRALQTEVAALQLLFDG